VTNDVEFVGQRDQRPLTEVNSEAKPLITIKQDQHTGKYFLYFVVYSMCLLFFVGKFNVTNDTISL
jgi:hypothetical protein